MVAELTIGRPDAREHDVLVGQVRDDARDLLARLLSLSDADAVAYHAVVAARRLPREDEEQRAARAATLLTATRGATTVPLDVARACAEAMVLAERIAPIGNRFAASDVAVAALLASAGLRGAAYNVRINLPGLATDDPLRVEAAEALPDLEAAAAAQLAATLAIVDERMAQTA